LPVKLVLSLPQRGETLSFHTCFKGKPVGATGTTRGPNPERESMGVGKIKS